jgi:hypothetical protein
MDQLQLETFLEQKTSHQDSKCTRCLRKKFKCMIIYMLLLISLTQFVIIIIDKMDEKYLNKILEVITSKNYTSLKLAGDLRSTPTTKSESIEYP